MKRLIKKSIEFNNRNVEEINNKNLIELNLLNEADIKSDRCPQCKFSPLNREDGFKHCPSCNSLYKMLDGKGHLIK